MNTSLLGKQETSTTENTVKGAAGRRGRALKEEEIITQKEDRGGRIGIPSKA